MEARTKRKAPKPKPNPKPKFKNPEHRRCARPKAVIIKSVEGVGYAVILKNLKNRIIPKELGATVRGIGRPALRMSWWKSIVQLWK